MDYHGADSSRQRRCVLPRFHCRRLTHASVATHIETSRIFYWLPMRADLLGVGPGRERNGVTAQKRDRANNHFPRKITSPSERMNVAGWPIVPT